MNDVKKVENIDDSIAEKRDKGASLVEYALLVALIAVICIAAISLLGQRASIKFSSVASAIQ